MAVSVAVGEIFSVKKWCDRIFPADFGAENSAVYSTIVAGLGVYGGGCAWHDVVLHVVHVLRVALLCPRP